MREVEEAGNLLCCDGKEPRVATLPLGTATGWWPQPPGSADGGALVSLQATNGERLCGALGEAGPGRLSVSVNGSPVVVSLGDVAAVSPVDSC